MSKIKLNQLRLINEYAYSKLYKVCMWKYQGDFGLTPYGRERAATCSGGFDGCHGDVEKVTVTEEGYTYITPYCASCKIAAAERRKKEA